MKPPWEGSWNGVRFRPEGGDHLESFYLKATAPDAERAFWLKATIISTAGEEPEGTLAEGWAIAFDHRQAERSNVAVKHSLAFTDATFDRRNLDIHWSLPGAGDEFHLVAGETHGLITSGAHRIEWQLSFPTDGVRPLVVFPHPRLYTGPFPTTKQISPYPDVRMSGQLTVDGSPWKVDQWHGYQGHNWGTQHVELYAWCHCNQWQQEEELVLEAASGRVRAGPLLLPVMSVVNVRHRGVDYPFNGLRQLVATRADIGLRRYTFSGTSRAGRIEALFEAPVEDFVGLWYRNPRGPTTHCLNSKLASGRIRFEPADGPPIELTTRAAALEVGTIRADHGVKMYA